MVHKNVLTVHFFYNNISLSGVRRGIKVKKLKVENCLNNYILLKRLNALNVGKNLKISEIEEDLANYCSVSRDMIVSIKSLRKTPSLAVALKIAEYFGESVNDIFYFKKEKQNTSQPSLADIYDDITEQ